MDLKSLPKILYIEDDTESRELVARLLDGRYVVVESGDAFNGIDLAKDTTPDLVLLDIDLPGITGYEVSIRLQSILPTDTPIIALTTDIGDGARKRALATGFNGFLQKPIDVDKFESQLEAFLQGKREVLDAPESYLREYQAELTERFEMTVRELALAQNRNYHLNQSNQEMVNILIRRQRMLEAGARVSHGITSILDLDGLLHVAANIICSEFELYYSGIFLLSEDGQSLVLHAGHGEPGEAMLKDHFVRPVDRHSMVGSAVLDKKAKIALDVEGEPSRFKNPYLPLTRSEMALPLIFKDMTMGVLTVQSAELNAFTEEDITALQSLADQIANAIHNAQLIRQLDSANQELVRSKTFEAIASATGEAIHWVGNKAAPVPGSIQRVRGDLLNLLAVFWHIIAAKMTESFAASAQPSGGPLLGLAASIFEEAEAAGVNLSALADELLQMPEKRRNAMVSLESMLEDLQIVENSATTILNIKEDLIGPARQRKAVAFSLTDEIERIVLNMALPAGVVSTEWPENLPRAMGDPRQIDQIFNNLIKNAWEALDKTPTPHISVSLKCEDAFLLACVRDNGPGIPSEVLEKIWVSFFTTKGGKGGTGLGLSACTEIARQNGGKIWVESQVGNGATFYVQLPIAKE
jgi:signal transduction histidine kinase/DNA-binding response OmpR family regulator